MKFVCGKETELQLVVNEVIKLANEHNAPGSGVSNSRAFVVGLYGDLGSAKTTFTKYLAKTLGVKEMITSPTFVIERNFEIKTKATKKFQRLYHFDVYRLESEKELLPLRWTEIINEPKNLVVIEWPEIVESALPKNILKIKFTFIDEKTREIEILS